MHAAPWCRGPSAPLTRISSSLPSMILRPPRTSWLRYTRRIPTSRFWPGGHDADRCRTLRKIGARIAVSETLEASLELAREVLIRDDSDTARVEALLRRFHENITTILMRRMCRRRQIKPGRDRADHDPVGWTMCRTGRTGRTGKSAGWRKPLRYFFRDHWRLPGRFQHPCQLVIPCGCAAAWRGACRPAAPRSDNLSS